MIKIALIAFVVTTILTPLIKGLICLDDGDKFFDWLKSSKRRDEEEAIEKFAIQYRNLMRNNETYKPYVWSPYTSFEDTTIGRDMAEKAMKQKVLDMPQLTFNRWLTFYKNNPSAWVIERNEYATFANIPYYVKRATHTDKRGKVKENFVFVPIFWTDAEEMRKYREWVETQYEIGNAAVYDREREKNMKVLIDYLQQDINDRRAETEADLAKMRDEVRTSTPRAEPMKLKLSNGVEVEVPKVQTQVETWQQPLNVTIFNNEDEINIKPTNGHIYMNYDSGKQYVCQKGQLIEIGQFDTVSQRAKTENPFATVKAYY